MIILEDYFLFIQTFFLYVRSFSINSYLDNASICAAYTDNYYQVNYVDIFIIFLDNIICFSSSSSHIYIYIYIYITLSLLLC